jgi:hypothetical protein
LVYVNWSYYTITVVYCQYKCVIFGDFFSGLLVGRVFIPG